MRGGGRGDIDHRIAELLAEREVPRMPFFIPAREKGVVLDAAQIDWIEAADYYVTLHAGPGAHLLRQTMEEIEKQLDHRQFFRVHRSAIINIDRVREIHPLFRGDCALVLADGRRIKLSRSRGKDFEPLFEQGR
jgi:two-component system, LytTR family, response regulator